MKIHPVGAELFHADRRTDMNLTVAFCNFANAPEKTGNDKYRQPAGCNNNGLLIIPVSSTCFGQLCPSSGALDSVLQLVV